MSPSLPVDPALSPEARPVDVDDGERVVLLDTLRGFALCGVFMANVFLWFNGRMFLSRTQAEAAFRDASWLDSVANYGFSTLIGGRFITLFSFLFGLGFAVQLGRAERRGASVVPVFTRRLVVMLGLGVAHLFLLFQGDIVSTYALLGFTLLLFHRSSDRTLLIWAAVLIFLSPMLVNTVQRLPQWLGSPGAAEAAKASAEHATAVRAQVLEAFMHGSWPDTVRAGAAYYFGDLLKQLVVFHGVIVGRFLLGLWAGRNRLFHDAPWHLGFFRRLLGWGLAVGIIASGLGVLVGQLMLRKVIHPESMPWLPLALGPVRSLAEMGMAAAYASAITLLFHRGTWRKWLAVLAPVGRMALTNYLMQSVLGVLVFYGYGLGVMGKLGSAAALSTAVAIFALQVVFSHLWLARFRFGPVEWVTRSLTYGRVQPLRRAAVPGGASGVA
ncbi:DUF418 domain-containing protein [Pyxidicoccus sp. 3LG]